MMLHANVGCVGKCSISLKLAIGLVLTFGTVYLIRTAFHLQSLPSGFITASLLSDASLPHVPACRPKSNIFFLKTHKCASSTVQNILLRYGAQRDLNFVLPSLGNYLGNQSPFHRSMASTAPWHRLGYNIFCHHTIFNKREVMSIMPKDTFYFTIARHPVTLFESLYEYADLNLKYHQNFEEFVYQRSPGVLTSTSRAEGYLGVNQMSYDMGINPRLFNNDSVVQNEIERLARNFDLVLLAELFDESMVLLADKLCWNLNDVTYFKHNSRKTKLTTFNETTVKKIEKLNSADLILYHYFRQIFQQQVEKYGGWIKLEKNVEKLRQLNREYENFCTKPIKYLEKQTGKVLYSNKVEHLIVGNQNSTCQMMVRNELSFTKHLKMTQIMKTNKKFGLMAFNSQQMIIPLNLRDSGIPMKQNIWMQIIHEMGFSPIYANSTFGKS